MILNSLLEKLSEVRKQPETKVSGCFLSKNKDIKGTLAY